MIKINILLIVLGIIVLWILAYAPDYYKIKYLKRIDLTLDAIYDLFNPDAEEEEEIDDEDQLEEPGQIFDDVHTENSLAQEIEKNAEENIEINTIVVTGPQSIDL